LKTKPRNLTGFAAWENAMHWAEDNDNGDMYRAIEHRSHSDIRIERKTAPRSTYTYTTLNPVTLHLTCFSSQWYHFPSTMAARSHLASCCNKIEKEGFELQ
jgi:hypothetical protein